MVWGMHSSQNDWWDIKGNSSHRESCFLQKKIICKSKRSSNICSLKVPCYIYGQHFTLQTDHNQLLTIFGLKKKKKKKKKSLPIHTANNWRNRVQSCQLQNGVPTIKKFSHADRLPRLIPKYKEPLEDTVIASLQSEGELKTPLCNTVRELPVMLEQLKHDTLRNDYINQIKVKIFEKDQRTTDAFSICNVVLLYRECVMIREAYLERFPCWPPREY